MTGTGWPSRLRRHRGPWHGPRVRRMPGPMEGVRVVEVGMWVAGPAAAGILGDWGADVLKIEPPNGDPMRGILAGATGSSASPPFELDNRNKRSVALNFPVEEARDIAARLVDEADVFVT